MRSTMVSLHVFGTYNWHSGFVDALTAPRKNVGVASWLAVRNRSSFIPLADLRIV
jgi:hypothetical protein